MLSTKHYMARLIELNEVLRHLKIPSSQIKRTGVELGNGSYGRVYEVDYNGKLCAAKEVHSLLLQLASTKGAGKLKDDFLREYHLWSTLRHPNIVQFLGTYYTSTDESGLPVMVLEKMQDSVTSLIEKHDNIPLLVKLSILHDVSLGLRYLHDHDPVVIHRDLSPNNILVTSHLEAKITDLGVAKAMMGKGGTSMLTKTPGTGVFMPPEALDDKPANGPALDVFSFGGVILYMTSRQWPTPKSWSQIDPKTKKRILLSEVERRQQYIDMMSGGDADLKPLVTSCLEDDPESRPSVIDISERLKTMKELYSKKTTRDGMNPVSWLASLSTQLQLSASQDDHSNKTTVTPPVAPLPKQTESDPAPIESVKQPMEKMVLKESTIPDLLSGPVNIKWEEGAPLPNASMVNTAVLFNGAIYVGGGMCDANDNVANCNINIYHPDTNKWGDPIVTPQAYFAMTVLVDKLIIVGGYSIITCNDTNELLVLENGQWKNYTQMPTARKCSSAVSYQAMMIVMGGGNTKHGILNTTELLDSTTGQWFTCDDLPKPLTLLQSAIVGDVLYVVGGVGTGDDQASKAVYAAPLDALSSHQLKWQQLADTPWKDSAAVSLNNEYLLAVGGYAKHDTLCVFKGAKGSMISSTSWVSIGSLPTVHAATCAVSLANQIIVFGGAMPYGKIKTVTVGTFQ